jgi:DNA-binding XRE family transcriptional regulator
LHQKDVAKIIGVTSSSIWNWEHGLEPDLQSTHRIIEFLGYLPFPYPEDSIERLAWFRKVHGLTLIKLGHLMNP